MPRSLFLCIVSSYSILLPFLSFILYIVVASYKSLCIGAASYLDSLSSGCTHPSVYISTPHCAVRHIGRGIARGLSRPVCASSQCVYIYMLCGRNGHVCPRPCMPLLLWNWPGCYRAGEREEQVQTFEQTPTRPGLSRKEMNGRERRNANGKRGVE